MNWKDARDKYDWNVNLGAYIHAAEHPGYFNRTITADEVSNFETYFRSSIDKPSLRKIAGEVCYWKNSRNYLARNKLTRDLINHLEQVQNRTAFIDAIFALAKKPSLENFKNLQTACDQKSGFATPLTFLSFFLPEKFPMVDKHIAYWWNRNKFRFDNQSPPDFAQREDGWIKTSTKANIEQNWNAYLGWTCFCVDYADRLNKHTERQWRARDVEMAVWMSQKKTITLERL